MNLLHVELRGFRNHEETTLDCTDGVNALVGDNGEGKTNVIEGISYLCLTKSFYAASDAIVLRQGHDRFDVQGRFRSDNGTTWTVGAEYDKATMRKTIVVNKKPVETLGSVIGQFPAVVLSPEQNGITFGAPTERRKFLDIAISQASKRYLDELFEYRKILRQRNKVLLDAKLERRDCSALLEPWDESLVQTGSSLMMKRAAFIEEFRPMVEDEYDAIAGGAEQPALEYVPSFACASLSAETTIHARFQEELRAHSDEERRTGTTVVGPHRDELELSLGGMSLRKFASQGEHKTYLVALKMAEFHYLRGQRGETPILLLDDVFSELDEHRSQRLYEQTIGLGQVFITATDERSLLGAKGEKNHKRFFVRQGVVSHAEAGFLVN